METTVNGWSTTLNYGEWGNNILSWAAFAQVLPASNVPEKAEIADSFGTRFYGNYNNWRMYNGCKTST